MVQPRKPAVAENVQEWLVGAAQGCGVRHPVVHGRDGARDGESFELW